MEALQGPLFFPHPLFPAPPHLGSFRSIPCHLRLYGDLPFLVVTLGTLPTVLSGTLAQLFRSVGFAKKQVLAFP